MKEEEIGSEITDCSYTSDHRPSRMSSKHLQEESDFANAWHEDYGTSQVAGAINNSWGDFESFSEFTPQSEGFCYSAEEESGAPQDNSSDTTSHSMKTYNGVDAAEASESHLGLERLLLDEDTQAFQSIFRDSFPDVPVDQCSEDVESLKQLMVSSKKDCADDELILMQPWPTFFKPESFTDASVAKPGCDWMKFESCANLLNLLGVDASNKLHVAPDSKEGRLFSYHIFGKTSPADLPLTFLTFYGKKSFFKTNLLRLDF
uniref:Aftiphilin clathrin-binding box domain-containing protein n=1 Tax=Leptobrachium leishanense TaxID=445787 RepID=A0A8C5WHX2_9ANUR